MVDSKNGIVGFIIGDALGVPVEFNTRAERMNNPITEMIGYGTHSVPKGCWSDDTAMVLATMDAITEQNDINCSKIADNFLAWISEAKYTATDRVIGIGRGTLKALNKYETHEDEAEKCGGTAFYENGNGSLMRILPVAYYCYAKGKSEEEVYSIVEKVSSITHRHEISIMGCFIYSEFAINLLEGKDLVGAYEAVQKIDYKKYFSPDTIKEYIRVIRKNIKFLKLDDISSSGYVVDTLEAVLWILFNTTDFNQALIGAINLGDDTDTIGACTGGLAGIYYGIDSIKESWKKDLMHYKYLESMCDRFNKVLNKESTKEK